MAPLDIAIQHENTVGNNIVSMEVIKKKARHTKKK